MSELGAAVVRAQLGKLDQIVANMRASKSRIKAALGDLKGIAWRRVADPAGDSGPFIIVVFAEPEAAKQFAGAAAERRLSATCLPDYGLHVYYNVKALVEKRSNSTDGFPWTHPANAALKREYGRGSLPRTDELLARAVVIPVPSSLTPEQESQYIAAFRQAHQAAGLS